MPIGEVIPDQTTTTPATHVTPAPCEPNNTACVATETTSNPSIVPEPTQTPITNNDNTIAQENQRIIDETLSQSQNQDTTSDSSSGGSSDSSGGSKDSNSNNQVDREDRQQHLGSETHFILMSEDSKITLFSIVSDEKDLNVNILPQTIRPINTFDNEADALQWISDYDSKN